MPVTRSGIQWTELYDTGHMYRESWVDGAQSSERFAEVDWVNSSLFVYDMVGYVQRGAGMLKRTTPERHPYFDNMFCTEAHSLEAYGNHINSGPNSSITLDTIRYRLVYRPAPDNMRILEDKDVFNTAEGELNRYVIRKKKWAFVNQQMPQVTTNQGSVPATLIFNGAHAGTPVPQQNVVRPQATIQMEYTLKRWPRAAVPIAAIQTMGYKVNNAAFDTNNGNYAAGTVAFIGADQRDYTDAAGDAVSDVIYLLAVKPEGWNNFPNSAWQPEAVIIKENGNPIFTSDDFKKLFTPA